VYLVLRKRVVCSLIFMAILYVFDKDNTIVTELPAHIPQRVGVGFIECTGHSSPKHEKGETAVVVGYEPEGEVNSPTSGHATVFNEKKWEVLVRPEELKPVVLGEGYYFIGFGARK